MMEQLQSNTTALCPSHPILPPAAITVMAGPLIWGKAKDLGWNLSILESSPISSVTNATFPAIDREVAVSHAGWILQVSKFLC